MTNTSQITVKVDLLVNNYYRQAVNHRYGRKGAATDKEITEHICLSVAEHEDRVELLEEYAVYLERIKTKDNE